MLNRFDFSRAFNHAMEAQQEIFAEALRDFVAMYPVQARIRQRVADHIAGGPDREREALEIWKMHPNALTRKCEIQYRRGILDYHPIEHYFWEE